MTTNQPAPVILSDEARRVLNNASRIHALHDADPKKDEDISWLVEALATENTALREQLAEAHKNVESLSQTIFRSEQATRMRDTYSGKVRAMRDQWRDKHASASNRETWRHFGTLFNGADEIITALESLTLDEEKVNNE